MLSKSKFIRGINCHKSLWLYTHKRKERRIEDITQFVFKQGSDVGEVARQYFPDGKLAVYEDYPNFESANRTKHFMEAGIETIYEATFIYNKIIIAVDILTKINGNWQFFEFKSTNSIKIQHINDVAIQYYVLSGYGIPIEDVSVMYMNRDYIRKGELDIKKLFIYKSVLKEVLELQLFVDNNIKTLQQIEKQPTEPQIEMGIQCSNPYKCDFYDYCNNLSPLKKREILEEQGNETKINQEELKLFLKNCPYPLYFLVFETIMPCIPMFDNTRPYQQIPFQYSLHYKTGKTGRLIHYEYLSKTEGDPRIDFIKQLINDTQNPGSIMVYDVNFERTRLREMQRDFPEYSEALEKIVDRLIDLIHVFRKPHPLSGNYDGKYLIKKAVSSLFPLMSFSDVEINDKVDVSSLFLAFYYEKNVEIKTKKRKALLKYCEINTYEMMRILEMLEKPLYQ